MRHYTLSFDMDEETAKSFEEYFRHKAQYSMVTVTMELDDNPYPLDANRFKIISGHSVTRFDLIHNPCLVEEKGHTLAINYEEAWERFESRSRNWEL